MNLLQRLHALARPDLEALLVRRPAAATQVATRGGGMTMLAEVLSSPDQVRGATTSLNRFQLQVLELACLLGGTLTEEAAGEQGMPRGTLADVAAELACLGLGFPDGEGGLHIPPEIARSIKNPAGLGPPLLTLMGQETHTDLKLLAETLGIATGLRKSDLTAAIVARLRSPDTVRDLVELASPMSRRVLDAIRQAGGQLQFRELADSLGSEANVGSLYSAFRREHKRKDGLPWLWAKGLVFLRVWESLAMVPAEVELALRGRAFPTWPMTLPDLELAPLSHTREPLDIVEEMTRALSYWARGDLPLLKSGGLGVRERRRIAGELGLDERRVDELLRLGSFSRLLEVRTETSKGRRRGRGWSQSDEHHFLIVTENGHRWLSAAPAESWLTLLRGWLDLIVGPLLLSDGTYTPPGRVVLEAVASLPRGQATSPQALGRRLSWHQPVAWGSDVTAIQTVATIALWLEVLGIGAAPPLVGVTELGRAALEGAGVEEVHDLLPPSVARCLVQADLTVVVPGLPGPELAGGLGKFADLQSSSAARVYRLTETSLRRALDQGMSAPEIEDFLGEWSDGELPDTVLELIRDAGRRHGRLRVGMASVYVASDDPALLAEVASSRKLRALQVRSVSPTAAVIEGKTMDQVLTALRRAGFMPTAEGPVAPAPTAPRSSAGAPPAGDLVRPMPQPDRNKEPSLSPTAAARLAGRLLSVPARPATRRRFERENPRELPLLTKRDLDEEDGEGEQAEILYLFQELEPR